MLVCLRLYVSSLLSHICTTRPSPVVTHCAHRDERLPVSTWLWAQRYSAYCSYCISSLVGIGGRHGTAGPRAPPSREVSRGLHRSPKLPCQETRPQSLQRISTEVQGASGLDELLSFTANAPTAKEQSNDLIHAAIRSDWRRSVVSMIDRHSPVSALHDFGCKLMALQNRICAHALAIVASGITDGLRRNAMQILDIPTAGSNGALVPFCYRNDAHACDSQAHTSWP